MSVIDLSNVLNDKLAAEVAARWHFTSGNDLATPMPPTPWVCEALAIAPGPVTIVGGAGFGGKTISLQAMLLAVASGRPLWGHFPIRKGVVKHFDFEQGKPLTKRRYQRIANAMGIDLRELEGALHLCSLPDAKLDEPAAFRELAWMLQGVTIAIIDAFRGAFPSALENDSGVRSHLDMLSKVSDITGCTIIVIAHSRKMSNDGDDVRSSLRGSGALYDAAQGVWMLDGMKGRPTRVNHTKERIEGDLKETFGLVIADVPDPCLDGGLKWGLSVEYLSGPETQAAYATPEGADNSLAINAARIESVGRRIGDILAGAPHGLTMPTLRGLLHSTVSNLDIQAVLPILIDSGAVVIDGKGTSAVYHHPHAREAREPGID